MNVPDLLTLSQFLGRVLKRYNPSSDPNLTFSSLPHFSVNFDQICDSLSPLVYIDGTFFKQIYFENYLLNMNMKHLGEKSALCLFRF